MTTIEKIDTPQAIVADALRITQREIDRTDDVIDSPDLFRQCVGSIVTNFGLAFVMEALDRTDPEVAAAVAKELWAIWDAGDDIGELTYEWCQNLAAGRRIDTGGDGSGYVFKRIGLPL